MSNRKIDEADEASPAEIAHAPVLTVRASSVQAKAVVLVLHGGRANSYDPVRARHLSPARMVPFARLLSRWGADLGLEVWSLRNRVRGWNGAEQSPVQDARWALEKIRETHPGLPVYLVGHSMGGSVALAVADDDRVKGVVSLAPWLNPSSDTTSVTERRVLIIHGDKDRWTSPTESLRYARRAEPIAEEVRYVLLDGVGHFMLSKIGIWHRLTVSYVLRSFGEQTGTEIPAAVRRHSDRLFEKPPVLPMVM